MCETHRALSSTVARKEAFPQIPKAAKMRPPITAEGDFAPDLPSAAPAVRRALTPPTEASDVPPQVVKPAKTVKAPEVAGADIDPWAREQARAMSRTMQIGLSRKETHRVAKAVTEVVGTRGLVSEIQGRAMQIIREQISAIGEARNNLLKPASIAQMAVPKRSTGTLHASNRPGIVAKPKVGEKKDFRPQYGQFPERRFKIEEPPKPVISGAEMERRKKALAAHLAAQKAEKKPE